MAILRPCASARLFALFRTKPLVEDGQVVGVQFNIKEPILKSNYDKWEGKMGLNDAMALNVDKLGEDDFDILIDLPMELLPHFGMVEDELYRVRCKQEGNLLKIYLKERKEA